MPDISCGSAVCACVHMDKVWLLTAFVVLCWRSWLAFHKCLSSGKPCSRLCWTAWADCRLQLTDVTFNKRQKRQEKRVADKNWLLTFKAQRLDVLAAERQQEQWVSSKPKTFPVSHCRLSTVACPQLSASLLFWKISYGTNSDQGCNGAHTICQWPRWDYTNRECSWEAVS